MLEVGKNYKGVISQLSAVRSAVVVDSENLVECVRNTEGIEDKVDEMIKEAVNLVVKSR